MLNNAAHFIFDSEHVGDIQSRLYGFAVTKDGIFTSPEELGDDFYDATGAWVHVNRTSEYIEITQDNIGCFGLFLFREGSYWALSNSFNHLLDFLKMRHHLTFNKDYADAYLAQSISSDIYNETIIKEISWLDRRAQIFITPDNTELSIRFRSLDEYTFHVDTEEGLHLLDAWHDKWASIMREAVRSFPGHIQAHMSGGFDTRMALVPILSSGADLNQIIFTSSPQREEDFQVASQVAERFGFRLNAPIIRYGHPKLPTIESFEEQMLSGIFFEKAISTRTHSRPRPPTFVFTGFGGELLRGIWDDLNYNTYIQECLRPIKNTGSTGTPRYSPGAKAIIKRGFESIEALYKHESTDLSTGGRYAIETHNRLHFGMNIAGSCLSHYYMQTPLLDPLLLKLRYQNNHSLLVVALILTRYHGDCARIPFQKGKSIPKGTLQYAQELNKRFPRQATATSETAPRAKAWQFLEIAGDVTTDGADTSMREQLLCAFESPTVQRILAKLYGANNTFWTQNADPHHPNINKYATVAIAKATDDVLHGKSACKDLTDFIKTCCEETRKI